MGVKVEVLAEGVDGHDDAGQPVGKVEGGAQVFEQALVRDAAQILEQLMQMTVINRLKVIEFTSSFKLNLKESKKFRCNSRIIR